MWSPATSAATRSPLSRAPWWLGRGATSENSGLLTPPDRVWEAVRAELDVAVCSSPQRPVADRAPPDSPAAPRPPAVLRVGVGRRCSRSGGRHRVGSVGLDRLGRVRGRRCCGPRNLQALPAHTGAIRRKPWWSRTLEGNKTLVIELNSPPPVEWVAGGVADRPRRQARCSPSAT